jgi:hypothetical protein
VTLVGANYATQLQEHWPVFIQVFHVRCLKEIVKQKGINKTKGINEWSKWKLELQGKERELETELEKYNMYHIKTC